MFTIFWFTCSFIKSPTSISVAGISELGNNASDSLNTCSSLGISYISVKLLKIDPWTKGKKGKWHFVSLWLSLWEQKPVDQDIGGKTCWWARSVLGGHQAVPFMEKKLWASVDQGMGWAWRLTGGCPGDGEVPGDRLVPTTNQTRAHPGEALWILQSHPHLRTSLWSNG